MHLAPYAMRDEDTRGRPFPEKPHPYRSEYQRDRDRIVHSKAFRRLENKTQVFDPEYSDHFRNRLTHSIEVSQIARTISEALGLNTNLTEVLALSHDIGHPPFSHEGEKVLDQIMKNYRSGFDHNLHALRIVEDFEEKYAGFRGLNLTFEVREGVIKHSRDYTESNHAYVDIRQYALGQRPPLEAQLIDLADEIAYSCADLDDGYDSGLLTLNQILPQVKIFRESYQEVAQQYSGAPEKLRVCETIRRMINLLVTHLISHTRAEIETHGVGSVEKVRKFPRRLFAFEKHLWEQNQELKRFLRENLYDHTVLQKAREKAQRLLEELFQYYLDRPEKLPESHHSRVPGLELHQVVCDYIAGMTDKYAQAKHAEILSSPW